MMMRWPKTSHKRYVTANQVRFADMLRALVALPWWAFIRRREQVMKIDAFAAEHNECCKLDWKGWDA